MAKSWEEMSRAERKVVLCEDVLARIEAERLIVARGSYMGNIYNLPEIVGKAEFEGTVTPDDCLLMEKHCGVCARGALLLSRIRLFNSVDWEDLKINDSLGINQDQTSDILSEAFDTEELLAIEAAFEAEEGEENDGFIGEDEEYSWDCIEFGLEHEYPDDRLIAIMQNIIHNNGEFLRTER